LEEPRKQYQIRRGAMEDCEGITNLCEQLGFPSSTEVVFKRLSFIMNNSDHDLFVVENAEGKIAGWIHVFLSITPYTDLVTEVGGLVINDADREQGIGRMLIQQAEQWAKSKQTTAVRIRSNVKRVESHIFYKAVGYEEIKKQVNYFKSIPQDL